MATSGDLEYAGFWQRFFAMIPDMFIAAALSYAVAGPMVQAGFDPMGLAVNGTSFAVFVAYYTLMQASPMQATVGKMLLGLKVADVEGAKPSAVKVLIREIAKLASAITLLIGYLLAAFTGRKQALHDMVASTVVLKVAPAKVMVGAAAVIASGALAGWMFQTFLAGPMQQAMEQMQAEITGQPLPSKKGPPPVAPKVTTAAVPVAPKPSVAPAPEAPKAATPVPVPVSVPVSVPAAPPPPPVAKLAPEPKVVATPPKERRRDLPAPIQARVVDSPMAPATAAAPEGPGLKYNDLMTAVLQGDAAAVTELLALGKWADKPDSRGVTPLTAAAYLGDANVAEVLLKAGAKPDAALAIARERRDAAMTDLLEKYRK